MSRGGTAVKELLVSRANPDLNLIINRGWEGGRVRKPTDCCSITLLTHLDRMRCFVLLQMAVVTKGKRPKAVTEFYWLGGGQRPIHKIHVEDLDRIRCSVLLQTALALPAHLFPRDPIVDTSLRSPCPRTPSILARSTRGAKKPNG